MAKGRFISKEISLDKRVNELSDGFSMVGFTWLITHADCEGRTYGDPAIVKSLIFPRRTDITIEMVENYIWEWQSAGLINLYESDGDIYIEFPNFEKHQTGLRKDREAKSTIPTNSGIIPAYSGKNRVKLSKVKLSKVNTGAKNAPDVSYEDCDIDGEPIKEKKKQSDKNNGLYPLAEALAEVTGMSLAANKEILFREAKLLARDKRVTPDIVRADYLPGGVWYKKDFRGKQKQKPLPSQVRETIFRYEETPEEIEKEFNAAEVL